VARPREHDELTARALLDAAERIIARAGPDAISVRTVADEAHTTVRAVYSLFGSKDGLVAALANKAFRLFAEEIDRLPRTDDPVQDLIEVALSVYRPFVLRHPSLYRIGFQRVVPSMQVTKEMRDARGGAILRMQERVQRLKDAGLLGSKTLLQAVIEFAAMCEGLANIELRKNLGVMPEGTEESVWRAAIGTVVHGFSRPGSGDRAATPLPATTN
jgi:AcrR family transcriptional regulator